MRAGCLMPVGKAEPGAAQPCRHRPGQDDDNEGGSTQTNDDHQHIREVHGDPLRQKGWTSTPMCRAFPLSRFLPSRRLTSLDCVPRLGRRCPTWACWSGIQPRDRLAQLALYKKRFARLLGQSMAAAVAPPKAGPRPSDAFGLPRVVSHLREDARFARGMSGYFVLSAAIAAAISPCCSLPEGSSLSACS